MNNPGYGKSNSGPVDKIAPSDPAPRKRLAKRRQPSGKDQGEYESENKEVLIKYEEGLFNSHTDTFPILS
jgi:hypothetical protein